MSLFYHWASMHLRWPAIVFTKEQIRLNWNSVAPATGVSCWPFALVTTSFVENKLDIPENVLARTALHELTHSARGHHLVLHGPQIIGDLDDTGHCSGAPCVINSGAANDQSQVVLKIVARPLRPGCGGCAEAWNFTKSSSLRTS